MFNLNDEVLAYCQAVYPSGLDRQARIDELADHLYCEIDRWIGEGLSEQEAFLRATDRLGAADDLAQEHLRAQTGLQKHAGVLFALCTFNVKALRRSLTAAEASAWIIGVSLFFAGLMIATALFTTGSESSQIGTYLWIAIWWVPYSLLCSVSGEKGKATCRAE